MKILFIFGTRPEAIKMAPLVQAFLKYSNKVELKVCVTAQHRQMLDQVLKFFDISVDYDLDLMRPDQNLQTLTADILKSTKAIFEDFKPNLILVHGDTTTSMASALSAFYSGIMIGHVEAGLRTHNIKSPFPEEINRTFTSKISDFHFAPTEESKQNLLSENVPAERVIVTGNTVIDALHIGLNKIANSNPHSIQNICSTLPVERPFILVTGHRRENFGKGFVSICKALQTIARRADINIIYPVHLNPNVKDTVYSLLSSEPNIYLIDPQPYESFIWLMNQSKLILTDSGGVQEEAPSLGKPVLVLRDTTERPEAVQAGTVILVGTDYDTIVNETLSLLSDESRYLRMSTLSNPYGDGMATKRIVEFIIKEFNIL